MALKKRKEGIFEETYFRIIAEEMPNMVFINKDGRIIYVNKKCEEVMGYTKEEFYADDFNFMVLIAPESKEIVMQNFQKHMKGIEVPPYEYRIVTKDGRYIDAIHTTKLINYGGGKAIFGVVTDITERKKMEQEIRESEEKFKSLVEHSLAGVYLIQDNIFKYVNPKLSEIFGYSQDELIDKKGPLDLTYLDDRKIVDSNIKKRIDGEERSINYVFRGVKKSGEVFQVEVFGSRILYKGKPAVIGTLIDITERFRLEKALKERIEELEDFYDMAVGRELRMKELKKEIALLKQQLSKYRK
jgi:PAS domain S-box-containing protein